MRARARTVFSLLSMVSAQSQSAASHFAREASFLCRIRQDITARQRQSCTLSQLGLKLRHRTWQETRPTRSLLTAALWTVVLTSHDTFAIQGLRLGFSFPVLRPIICDNTAQKRPKFTETNLRTLCSGVFKPTAFHGTRTECAERRRAGDRPQIYGRYGNVEQASLTTA